MLKKVKKIYCFADESGQDTGGEMFLVSVVLKDAQQVSELRHKMEEIEQKSDKRLRKWTKTPNVVKQKFLFMLMESEHLKQTIFYSVYRNSKGYTALLALTIAKSINAKVETDYVATIVIDGLQDTETESVRHQLKNLKIHYTRIRGMKDEQEPLLRLADSMAGFVRDYIEGQEYAAKIFKQFLAKKIIREI